MANEVSIKITADDMASGKIKNLNDRARDLRGSFTKLAAAGTGVVGMLGLFTKEALDQEIGVQLLDNALQKINMSYEAQEEHLEATFASIQKLTNFGDDEQRDVLQRLITATGDYELALQALPLVLDVAAKRSQDTSSIVDALGRAFNGQIGGLTRYAIKVEEGADAMDILESITRDYGGAAEAAKSPLTDLNNLLGDLREAIGDQLLPVMTPLFEDLSGTVSNIIAWTEANPKLTKTIVLGAAALGATAVALGVIGVALPAIITGFTSLAPAIAGAGAMGAVFMMARDVVKALTGDLNPLTEETVDLGDELLNVASNIGDVITGMFNLADAQKEVAESTEEVTSGLSKEMEALILLGNTQKTVMTENQQALKEDRAEVARIESDHRKVIGAQIRAEQKAKKAAEAGDFTMTYADFLAIENARVMGMPDVMRGRMDAEFVSDPLARAFRHFQRNTQVSEHGEKARVLQDRLARMVRAGGMHDSPILSSVPQGDIVINMNGPMFGNDEIGEVVQESVKVGLETGGLSLQEFTN
tara:strand:- start:320 stop:1915 length:1596 start_codon:yes stop_codon:yes gene_type:complete